MKDIDKVNMIITGILRQVGKSAAEKMMIGVVVQALKDLALPITTTLQYLDKLSAYNYLHGVIPHAEAVDVNSDWIHELIDMADLSFKPDPNYRTPRKVRKTYTRRQVYNKRRSG